MTEETGFVQPVIDPAVGATDGPLPVTIPPVAVVDNSSKTDELSVAVRAAEQPVIVAVVEPEKPVAPYILEYSLDGQPIKECHATVDAALASVRRLRQLGIIAATSTAV